MTAVMTETRRAQIRASTARIRAQKRADGLIQKQVWVRPEDWPRVAALLAELARAGESDAPADGAG